MASVAKAVVITQQPDYGTVSVTQEPGPARAPSPPSVVDNIERAIQSHHDRMAYYRQLSGHGDPAETEAASLQSEPERPRPTLWQSIWRCIRCLD